jgi:two-component system nitrate/nitrite response regulator NarL
MAAEIDDTLELARCAGRKMPTLVIANRHDIAGAGIEILLQAGGHNVIARCLHEDELLRIVEAHRPDIILLAENIVGQEATKTVLRLRAHNCSVAIIFLLEEREAITAADLLDLDVEGILLSAACAKSVIDCVESVRHGRKWIDPNLLCHLAMAERPRQIPSSLTAREAEIARLVSRGLRNKEIARELHLSEGTVKMHLHHIYDKLRLGGRTQLALSTAVTCAPMRASGDGVHSPSKPACPDSADLLIDKEATIVAVEFAVDKDSIRLLSEQRGDYQRRPCFDTDRAPVQRLNTPMPPLETSGTSGIRPHSTGPKLNGALNSTGP